MRLVLICITVTGALASPALAHTGVGQTNSFASGVAHLLSGADHILAMVAIGLWGVLRGGRAVSVWPMAFVATMLGGFAAATLGFWIPFVEPAIRASLVVLGLLIALAAKTPVWLGAAFAGLFAFLHGNDHSTETTAANLTLYAVGFAATTAGLHATGIGVASLAERPIGDVAVRVMGGLAVFGGFVLVAD
jgi:urease accessory protein